MKSLTTVVLSSPYGPVPQSLVIAISFGFPKASRHYIHQAIKDRRNGIHPVDLETVSPHNDRIRTGRDKLGRLFSGCPPTVWLPLSMSFFTTVALSSPGGFLVAFRDRPRLFARWLKRCTRGCGESCLTGNRRVRSFLFVGVRFGVLSS